MCIIEWVHLCVCVWGWGGNGCEIRLGTLQHKLRGQPPAPLDPKLPADGQASWTAVFIYEHADTEFNCNDLGLPHLSKSELPCGYCWCDRNPLGCPWNHLSLNAQWVTRLCTPEEWAARLKTGNYHPLLDIEGFGPGTPQIDVLHVVDNEGTASHAIGNVCLEMVSDREFPDCRTNADGMNYLNSRIVEYRRTHTTLNLPKLRQLGTMQMFSFSFSEGFLG